MATGCSASSIYPIISDLMRQLFHNSSLTDPQKLNLTEALDKYFDIECDVVCAMPQCPYTRPSDWVSFLGYTSLSDLLDHYDYEEGIAPIKVRGGIDTLRATWARRPGH
jgi:hypothetical protein